MFSTAISGPRSLEDALTDPLCDAVWIAGPTPLHLDCIRLAAEAGKACNAVVDSLENTPWGAICNFAILQF